MDAGQTRIADERRQFGAPASAVPAAAGPPPATPAAAPPSPGPKPAASSLPAWTPAAAGRAMRRAFDHELERGNLFLFTPVFMAAGALAYFTLRDEPGLAPLVLSLVAAVALSAVTLSRPALHALLLALAMAAAGMLAAKVETLRAATPMLGAEISTRLTARVARVEHQASGRVRLTLDVVATERPVLRYAPQRVRATARAVPEGLAPGDTVRGVVRLLPPSGPVRPGSYDFAFESYFSGIGAVGFFLVGPEIVASDVPATLRERAAARVEGWRGRMAAHIESRIGGPEGAIAAALITGIRAGIPEELNEAMRITGLYHVISISGLHMALVAGTLMLSLRAGFAFFPTFAMRRPVKKYAAAAALAATAFYLAMSGADVAAQRSFIMLAVMLLAVLFDRAALTMRNLAISALIILVLAPHEVAGPSFQMSFAATAALVAAYAGWRDYRDRREPAKPHRRSALSAVARGGMGYAAGLAMTSVVAGLATALFTAWHFQQVSPLGLVANLAAMPVVSVIVMPMAVLASLAMPFGLDAAPLWLMGQGIAIVNAIAWWLAERSALDATGAIPLSAVLVLTAALAILTMAGSGLRWAALPLLGAGIGLLAMREVPDAFVSEDARLVAIRLADGRIAVNRDRPRAFTMQNWQRAFGGGEVLRPRKDGAEADARAPSAEPGFSCDGDLCIARREDGAVIAHAGNAAAASPLCGRASLIVIDDATAENPCRHTATAVITRRDLARWGSAEIRFRDVGLVLEPNDKAAGGQARGGQAREGIPPEGASSSERSDGPAAEKDRSASKETAPPNGQKDPALYDTASLSIPRAELRFAISEPYRPWHEHRRFSREARGLAPYVPSRRNATE